MDEPTLLAERKPVTEPRLRFGLHGERPRERHSRPGTRNVDRLSYIDEIREALAHHHERDLFRVEHGGLPRTHRKKRERLACELLRIAHPHEHPQVVRGARPGFDLRRRSKGRSSGRSEGKRSGHGSRRRPGSSAGDTEKNAENGCNVAS